MDALRRRSSTTHLGGENMSCWGYWPWKFWPFPRDGKRAGPARFGPARAGHGPKWVEPIWPVFIRASFWLAQPGPKRATGQNGLIRPQFLKLLKYIISHKTMHLLVFYPTFSFVYFIIIFYSHLTYLNILL